MSVVAGMVMFLGAATAQEAAESTPIDKVVCKRIDQGETGSHLGSRRKVCKTTSEWKLEQESVNRSLRAIRDRSGVNPNDVGGQGNGRGGNGGGRNGGGR